MLLCEHKKYKVTNVLSLWNYLIPPSVQRHPVWTTNVLSSTKPSENCCVLLLTSGQSLVIFATSVITMSLFMLEWVALIRERWLKKLKRRKPRAVCLSNRDRRKTFLLNNIISNFICCSWQLAAEDQFRREALDEFVISSDNPPWMVFIRIFTSIFMSLSCKSSPEEVKWREARWTQLRWNNDVWNILWETETKCLCGLCVRTMGEWQKQIEISLLYHPQTFCVSTSPYFYFCSSRQLKTTSCAFQLWHATNNFHSAVKFILKNFPFHHSTSSSSNSS